MKKMMIILASVLLSLNACADRTQVGSFTSLPQPAQVFVETYFTKADIAVILYEREGLHNEYEVRLNNGTKIEFDYQGNLGKVDCKTNAVPAGIVPTAIVQYVATNHPTMFIVEYSIDRRKQSVELNTEMEIEFDKAGNFLRYDW